MVETNPLPKPKSKGSYYYISTSEVDDVPPLKPSLVDDVIRLYDIDDLASSLARTNPDGTKGIKLRKSYKSHILDLPGKHSIPTEDKSFLQIALQPENPDFSKPEITPFPMEYLEKVLRMEKTGPNGIPGFDPDKLALATPESVDTKKDKKRKPIASPDLAQQPDSKKRHVQVTF